MMIDLDLTHTHRNPLNIINQLTYAKTTSRRKFSFLILFVLILSIVDGNRFAMKEEN